MFVITGVGRSGTSLVAGIFNRLSLTGDGRFMAADKSNPRGYYEDEDVVSLNNFLLTGLHCHPRIFGNELTGIRDRLIKRWIQAHYLLPGNERRMMARAEGIADDLKATAEANRGAFVKDPRFSSTVGVWMRHVEIEGLVYCIRHPAEVVDSMAKAYGAPRRLGYWIYRLRVGEFFGNALPDNLLMLDYNRLVRADTRSGELLRLLSFCGITQDVDALVEGLSRDVIADVPCKEPRPVTCPRAVAISQWLCDVHAGRKEVTSFSDLFGKR